MTGQEFLDAITNAGAEPFDLSEFDQCPRCGMIRGAHTVDCDADAIEALHAFGEAIAACARARLVARAMDWREVRVRINGVEFVATHWPGEWEIERRWREREREHEAVVATVPGSSAVAAEVVDTLPRLVAEWEAAQ